MKLRFLKEFLINGHEVWPDCATEPQKIRDFDEHRRSICDFVNSMLFLIKKHLGEYMAKIRVYELAKKLNMTNKVLLSKLKAMNIDVKSHMSSLEDESVVQIKENLLGKKKIKSDIRVKSSVIRRRKQKKSLPVSDVPENEQEQFLSVDTKEALSDATDVQKDSEILKTVSGDKSGQEGKKQILSKVSEKDKKKSVKAETTGAVSGKKADEAAKHSEAVKSAKKHVKLVESAKIIKPAASLQPDKSVKPVKNKTMHGHEVMGDKSKIEPVPSAKTEKSVPTGIKEKEKEVAGKEDDLKVKTKKVIKKETKKETKKKSAKDIRERDIEQERTEAELKTETADIDKLYAKSKDRDKAGTSKETDSLLKAEGKADSPEVTCDKKTPDSEVKKKRRRKKKTIKKSTPAKIIRMAVPIPVDSTKEKDKHGLQGKRPKPKRVIDKPARSSAKPVYKKSGKGKIAVQSGSIPVTGPPAEPKVVRKKDKKKKDHGIVTGEEFTSKKKRLKKRKSIVEGKDLYESKRGRKRGRKKDSRGKKSKILSTTITTPKAIKRRIKIDETIELSEFAKRMGIKANEMIQKLMTLGVMVTLNQTIDFDTATLVASEFGFEVEKASFEEDILIHAHDTENDAGTQITRPPVVTIMGHVDHGKTSLLDVIRKSKITTGEAGGITQHIGAYNVKTENGTITFLDTPGHAAFTSMRARGAQVTDIVVLVVAADDGVMPQTIEAINHSKDAGVPVVVAINKMDKPDADPDRVTRELSEHGLVSEDWGGDVIFVKVSAKAETGIDTLLEMILLQSEVLELKANPDRFAKGHVVEARLDAGRGPIATILVEQGTLKAGQPVVCGLHAGKIRIMIDDTGTSIKEAGPSTPVEIIGLSGVPEAGDEFVALDSEKDAKQISLHRMQKQRSKELAKKSRANLEKLFASMGTDQAKELNLIIKADVNGSIEALNDSLMKLAKDEVTINIVHSGTGTINESDVSLAVVSHAIIIGFNVRPGSNVREMAKKENVDMRFYDIIYNVINDIKAAINGLMPSTFHEIIIGTAEVRDTFVIPNKGTIAGSFVVDGKVVRGEKIRLLRDGVVKCDSVLSSLRRFKDDVKEVAQGYECGISLEKYNDIKIGDVFECYKMEERRPEMEPVKE